MDIRASDFVDAKNYILVRCYPAVLNKILIQPSLGCFFEIIACRVRPQCYQTKVRQIPQAPSRKFPVRFPPFSQGVTHESHTSLLYNKCCTCVVTVKSQYEEGDRY